MGLRGGLCLGWELEGRPAVIGGGVAISEGEGELANEHVVEGEGLGEERGG